MMSLPLIAAYDPLSLMTLPLMILTLMTLPLMTLPLMTLPMPKIGWCGLDER